MELKDCSKCKGVGKMIDKDGTLICKKCNGKGKVDWIEQLLGIKFDEHIFFKPDGNKLYLFSDEYIHTINLKENFCDNRTIS